MIYFFIMQIRLGRITVEDVPQQFRKAVSEKLREGNDNNAH